MKNLAFQYGLLVLLLAQPTYAQKIENFDTDPGWTRFSNPTNFNDFGFQNSNLAGGTAGEAGGFFSVTNVPVWYGDENIGNFGGDQALSASGILNFVSVEAGYDTNVFIGHFDNGGFSVGGQNGIGFQVLENGADSFRILSLTGSNEDGLFTINGLSQTRTWSYNYDPSADSFGTLTVSISGPGGGTVTQILSSDARGSIGSIETFGMAVKPHDLVDMAQAEIYIDNLNYTSSTISAVQDLISQVLALNVQQGISNSLDGKLAAVINVSDDMNENNDVAAINSLYAFINALEAQRGNKITEADACSMIQAADQIIVTLGAASSGSSCLH